MPSSPLSARRATWQSLFSTKLPSLAKAKDPAQKHWPVTLDHCFGRIILDKVIGQGQGPWTERIKGPAIRNMSDDQIEECIELAEQIINGEVDLVELDEESLNSRGKKSKANGGEKRKRDEGETQTQTQTQTQDEGEKRRKGDHGSPVRNGKSKSVPDDEDVIMASQSQIQSQSAHQNTSDDDDDDGEDEDAVMASQSQPQPQTTSKNQKLASKAAKTDSMAEERHLIESSSLADYRKRVLLALCQVPKGKYTTYAAISNFLQSSPRAVGNAMRNNPFAPAVPCHRVLAADGKIGGYCGQWGEGDLINKKRKLLREEGLGFDPRGKVIGGPFRGFK